MVLFMIFIRILFYIQKNKSNSGMEGNIMCKKYINSILSCLLLSCCILLSGCNQEDDNTGTGAHMHSLDVKVLEIHDTYYIGEVVEEETDFEKGMNLKITYDKDISVDKKEAWITPGRVELDDIKVNDYIVARYFKTDETKDENVVQANRFLYIGTKENYQEIKEKK